MSLLVSERQTNIVAIINPSEIPSEEGTKTIKAISKEWITNEIDIPL